LAEFRTTPWSLILAANGVPGKQSGAALAALFERYWYPVYAYTRSQGYRPEDAEDVVQSYFASLLERRGLAGLSPDAGQFRAFLLVSIRNFISHEREGRRALKRGGGKVIESLDTMTAEVRLSREPYQDAQAEIAFERRWATMLVQRAIEALEGEFEAADQLDRFRLLRGQLTGEATLPYVELAKRLEMTEQGIKSIVRRMRTRFGVLLRGEVLQTIDRPENVEAEIRQLLTILSTT